MSFKVHCGLPILRVGPRHTRLSKGCISCCIAFGNPCFRGQHKASQTPRSKLSIEQLMTPKWYAGSDKHQQNGCPKKPTHRPTPPGREEKRIPEKFGDPSTSKQLHFKTHQEQRFCFSTFRGCHSIGFWNPPLLAKAVSTSTSFVVCMSLYGALCGIFDWAWRFASWLRLVRLDLRTSRVNIVGS